MSYKSTLINLAINKSPKKLMLWLANKKIKGVAQLTDYYFNATQHKLYVQLLLKGEQELEEIWIEDFTLVKYQGSYKLVIHQALSTRPWIDSFLRNFALHREIKIPEQHADLVRQLLSSDESEIEEQ